MGWVIHFVGGGAKNFTVPHVRQGIVGGKYKLVFNICVQYCVPYSASKLDAPGAAALRLPYCLS
jgi:hypothetical protein